MIGLRQYISSLLPFSDESWEILTTCFTEVRFKKNDILLKEGQVCHELFFLETGFCKATHNLDGKEINTAFYFEEEFATNSKSLIASAPSELSIIACEEVRALRFEKTTLLSAYKQSHEIEAFGRKVLESITLKQEEHANSFKLLTPRQRFDALVANHPDLLQRVSLTQIASYLGISRETLSRYRSTT